MLVNKICPASKLPMQSQCNWHNEKGRHRQKTQLKEKGWHTSQQYNWNEEKGRNTDTEHKWNNVKGSDTGTDTHNATGTETGSDTWKQNATEAKRNAKMQAGRKQFTQCRYPRCWPWHLGLSPLSPASVCLHLHRYMWLGSAATDNYEQKVQKPASICHLWQRYNYKWWCSAAMVTTN